MTVGKLNASSLVLSLMTLLLTLLRKNIIEIRTELLPLFQPTQQHLHLYSVFPPVSPNSLQLYLRSASSSCTPENRNFFVLKNVVLTTVLFSAPSVFSTLLQHLVYIKHTVISEIFKKITSWSYNLDIKTTSISPIYSTIFLLMAQLQALPILVFYNSPSPTFS
jgi:hypothetical protein